MTRRASSVPGSFDKEAGTIRIRWATGSAVRNIKWGMDGPRVIDERLSLDPAHIRQDRMKKGLPFLDDHPTMDGRTGVRNVLGKVEKNEIGADGIEGTVRFSKRADDAVLAGVIQDVGDGILDQFSPGYRVYAWQITENDEGRPDDYLGIDWEPLEVSVTPIGAEVGTGARSHRGDGVIEVRGVGPLKKDDEEEGKMADEKPVDVERVRSDATAAATLEARSVMTKLLKRASELAVDLTVVEDVMARGLSLDDGTDALIAAQKRAATDKAKAAVVDMPAGQARTLVVGKDQKEKDAQAIIEYLGYRGAPAHYKLTEGAKRFMGRSLVEICRHVCESHGVNTEGMGREDVVERAMLGFGKRDIGGMHTTSDFPNLLGEGLLQKTLKKAYDAVPDDFSEIVGETTFADPRVHNLMNVGSFGTLRVVGEAEEYKRVTLGEESEEVAMKKRGEIFALSLEAILNDDLRAFTSIPAKFGAAAKLTESYIVFGLLVDNALMADGFAVFSTEHANIGTAAAPDTTGVTDARTLMRKQHPIGRTDSRLGIKPFRVLSPYKYETGLSQLMKDAARLQPTTVEEIVPGWIRDMGYIVSDVLDIASTQKWYAIANPMNVESIIVARLEGQGPFKVFQRDGWNVDGIEWKVRHWFGAGIVDYRGLYYNAGV